MKWAHVLYWGQMDNINPHENRCKSIFLVYVVGFWHQSTGPRRRKEWANDQQVHTVVFPSDICAELLAILGLSNLCQPPSMRIMRGFSIGYLDL